MTPRAAARRSAAIAALTLAGLLPAAASPDSFRFGPYKDVTQDIDAARPEIRLPPWTPEPPALVVWAFATGDCRHERWGAFDTARFAALGVAAFEREGRDYVLSTGGEADGFSCGDPENLERFVARYDSPRLVGVDFDIERKQSGAQIDALVRGAMALQRQRPALRVSFTIATHGAVDGSRRSLNATGEQVLASLRAAGFDDAIINLMTMNYGPPDRRWCAPAEDAARCDMLRSALQAARNVHEKYGLPYRRIALTMMLGENDVQANVLSPGEAGALAREARRLGLAGVHWWSLDRDRGCEAGQPRVSPRCHGLTGIVPGTFASAIGTGVAQGAAAEPPASAPPPRAAASTPP